MSQMDKILKAYNLQRLNYEETENLNRCIISKKSESVTQNSPNRQKSRNYMTSLVNSTNFQRISTNPSQTLPKINEEGTFPNSSYEASITRISKSNKVTIMKENQRSNQYPQLTQMQNDQQILTNQIQQYFKRSIYRN